MAAHEPHGEQPAKDYQGRPEGGDPERVDDEWIHHGCDRDQWSASGLVKRAAEEILLDSLAEDHVVDAVPEPDSEEAPTGDSDPLAARQALHVSLDTEAPSR